MMGSGKSTIGTLVGARLGWPYYDNDELLQRMRGETAKELLANEGVTDATWDAEASGITSERR